MESFEIAHKEAKRISSLRSGYPLYIKKGANLDLVELSKKLTDIGYSRTDSTDKEGNWKIYISPNMLERIIN